ncbi:MAG TPA: arsenite efflux transporter metallochaperone ArsD [Symbiobacteriaceae bacterium]|nr:arsenite efflux transporter metallochaperone ArsD [Symbiobacteriaceae bacterium]
MPKIQIFERAMCCSTGVCGPNVDPLLVRFAADLEWLKRQGVEVERSNLSQQPRTFAETPLVRDLMHRRGLKVLPLILVEGQIAFEGAYPTREELAARLGLAVLNDDDELPVIQPKGCC